MITQGRRANRASIIGVLKRKEELRRLQSIIAHESEMEIRILSLMKEGKITEEQAGRVILRMHKFQREHLLKGEIKFAKWQDVKSWFPFLQKHIRGGSHLD